MRGAESAICSPSDPTTAVPERAAADGSDPPLNAGYKTTVRVVRIAAGQRSEARPSLQAAYAHTTIPSDLRLGHTGRKGEAVAPPPDSTGVQANPTVMPNR